jgi:hypothetical protein
MNFLSNIGDRGVVIHAGDRNNGTYRYFPDNDQESWRSHRVDLAKFAAAREIDPASIATLVAAETPVAAFTGPGKIKTVFLNLAAFHDLGKAGSIVAGNPGDLPAGDAYLIYEGPNYFAISAASLHALDSADAGEAKILVRRGAVTAAIPNNDLPIGTNCLLVNLTQLLP